MLITRRAAYAGALLFIGAASAARAQTGDGGAVSHQSERELAALACRMLGKFGLVRESIGHVSMRTGPDRMLLRCRGPEESGLQFTTADSFREVDFNGQFLEDGTSFQTPTEWPIHAEIYRSRPEAGAVVHAHPTAVVTALAAGLTLQPFAGAYNARATMLVARGIPVYPSSVRITTPEDGREMVRIMGDSQVCLLRGHGLVTAASTMQQAVLWALATEDLAQMALDIASTGATPTSIPRPELEEFMHMDATDDGSRSAWIWRYYTRLLGE